MDRAAVGAVEVAARLAGILGEREPVRLPERQRHAAQPDAPRAVRLETGHVLIMTAGYRAGMALHPSPAQRRHHDPAGRLRHLRAQGDDAVTAVLSALEKGYRLIDTAVNYGNEAEVGEAIRRSGVPRDEIVVTSKIPGRHHAYDDAIASTRESLERLGLDRIDVHLIHWPNPAAGQVRRDVARAGAAARRRAGPLPRRLELHRGAPAPGHRRHRRDAGAQPDRAASLLPAGRDARGRTTSSASSPSRGARSRASRQAPSPSRPSSPPPRRTA